MGILRWAWLERPYDSSSTRFLGPLPSIRAAAYGSAVHAWVRWGGGCQLGIRCGCQPWSRWSFWDSFCVWGSGGGGNSDVNECGERKLLPWGPCPQGLRWAGGRLALCREDRDLSCWGSSHGRQADTSHRRRHAWEKRGLCTSCFLQSVQGALGAQQGPHSRKITCPLAERQQPTPLLPPAFEAEVSGTPCSPGSTPGPVRGPCPALAALTETTQTPRQPGSSRPTSS